MALPVITTIQTAKDIAKMKLREEFDGIDNKNELEIPDLKKGERVETYQTNHPRGSIIVHYDGGQFADKAESFFAADRTMRFAVLIQVRVSEGVDYKDAVIERVMLALAGVQFWTLQNTGRRDRFGIATDEYISPEENIKKDSYEFLEHVVVIHVPTEFRQKEGN